MILLIAVLAGLLAGLERARLGERRFQLEPLKHARFLVVAGALQGLAFYVTPIRIRIPDQLAAFFLVSSQLCLLVFVWLNRTEPGFWILGTGLAMNLLVIAANGGLMPISPQTAAQLFPSQPADAWESGARLGWSKDILLARSDTRLWWLSDWLVFPGWFSTRFVFSPGDVLIAMGAFWFLWTRGGPQDVL